MAWPLLTRGFKKHSAPPHDCEWSVW